MARLRIELVRLVNARARRDIQLTADNGLDARGLRCAVKVHDTVHNAMIGDRHGALPEFFRPLGHLPDPACAVEQTVFTVHMKMNKIGHTALH